MVMKTNKTWSGPLEIYSPIEKNREHKWHNVTSILLEVYIRYFRNVKGFGEISHIRCHLVRTLLGWKEKQYSRQRNRRSRAGSVKQLGVFRDD